MTTEELSSPCAGDFAGYPAPLGLFPSLWMSDDFDAPLPDELWLGEQ